MQSYSFCTLRYCHDPSVGEAVNVGILFYAPDAATVRFLYQHHTAALSGLFRGFDRDEFLKFLSRLEKSVESFHTSLTQSSGGLFGIENAPTNAGDIARWLVPDGGLSFQFGETRAGVTDDVMATARAMFERQVVQQRPLPREHKRRGDEAVWSSFYGALRSEGVTKVLQAYIAPTPLFEIPFDHAYKNEKWHAVEPLSFDYSQTDEIRKRASQWFGYCYALSESAEFSSLSLLLGAPTNPAQKAAYAKAKSLLSKAPVRPQIIEEDEAEEFASHLASEMKKHGVLPTDESQADASEQLDSS